VEAFVSSQPEREVSGDGSYTNGTVLRQLPEGATFIGRIRRDAKLCYTLTPARGLRRRTGA
jgi:hypothetical protein